VASPDPLPVLLAPFLARPDRAGILCDFDGTLSAIVDDPARARPVPGAVRVLGRLARDYRTVAVISGRPVAFLREHLGGRGLVLSGLYGLERLRGAQIEEVDGAGAWRPVVAEVAARAQGADGPGVDVEPKGLSVTLHYRNWPGRETDTRAWVEAEARRTGLVIHPGRLCFELRPPIERDKGSVVRELAAGLEAACFLGDDAGDLAAFDALDALERDGVFALRVGVRSTEGPAEILERSDVQVDGPAGAVELLERLRPPRPP
jgi:trehalose 6-phosphate phosphatase